jgi:hypothetical protein
VKRTLLRNRRLTGKTLEFALTVVGEDSEIGEKPKQAEGAMPSMMMAVSPKNAAEKLDILSVESVDVIIDKGLDFCRRFLPRSLRASRKWQPRHSSHDRDEFASPHRLSRAR